MTAASADNKLNEGDKFDFDNYEDEGTCENMNGHYMLIERDSEGWFVGSVPELPGCHTQGRTIEELTERMREAIEVYLEDSETPASNFVGVHLVPA